MTRIQDRNKTWFAEVAPFKVPLRKGMRIVTEPGATHPLPGRDDGKPEPKSPQRVCTLMDWQYRIREDQQAELELVVKELKTPLLDRLLQNEDNRFVVSIILAMLTVAPIVVFGLLLRYQTEYMWALAGHYGRGIVGWSLFILCWLILPTRFGWYESSTFRNTFLAQVSVLTGIVLALLWSSISVRPDNFGWTNAECAAYAHHLVATLNSNYWPFLVTLFTWAAIVFKYFGFETAEKAADALKEEVKPKSTGKD